MTFRQTEANVITTGCFNVTLEDGDAISLNNAYPMTDEEGLLLMPYTFTIKNNCTEKASFILNLETVSSGNKILPDEYLKVSLKNNESELFLSTLNSTNENLEKVIETASKAYKLAEGVLGANESKTFDLRLWMDENTPVLDEVMNASSMGKITITSSYVAPQKNLMVPVNVKYMNAGGGDHFLYNSTYSHGEKYLGLLTRIIFQDKMNPYTEAVDVVDFSEANNESVLGYYVLNEKVEESEYDSYTLYIQADGKISMNPNGSYYFFVIEEYYPSLNDVEFLGIENLDTSNVTNMSWMFYSTYAEKIDISHLDTSNVTDMSWMFYKCSNLTSLDLSTLDTSNVTNMRSMFGDLRNLTTLDLSSFDTSKVTDMGEIFSGMTRLTSIDLSPLKTENVTNMDRMFSGCSALTKLDLSNIDTSKVTAMSYMFSGCSGLTSLDLSDFDTSKVTTMSYMFSGCSGLTSLDLSNFDTSKVTTMRWMLEECSALTSLDLSSFDTSNVVTMSNMFNGTSNLTIISYGDNFIHKEAADIYKMYNNCPANKPTHESWNSVTW